MFVTLIEKATNNEILTFSKPGAYQLGRGNTLKCLHKMVSRNHATITITKDSVVLTANNFNPTYVQSLESNESNIILTKGQSRTLKNGDEIGLLLETFWFLIRITNEIEQPKDICSQKNMNESAKVDEINEVDDKSSTETSQQDVNYCAGGKKPKLSHVTILNENDEVNTENTENVEQNTQNVNENSTDNDHRDGNVDGENSNGINEFSTSSNSAAKETRQKCWYGGNCFRKSETHKNEFSHPSDPDYDENDENTSLPMCPYGDACYRRNPEHRRMYQHHEPPQSLTKYNLRQRKNKRQMTTTFTSDDDDSDEDPFVDNSSDEFDFLFVCESDDE